MGWLPHRDDAVALRLDDLASALDAGLGADAVLAHGRRGRGADAGGGLVAALIADGLALAPTEQRILEAGEAAGELPRALRGCAATRRQRAALVRGLLRRAAYPILLLVVGLGVVLLVGLAQGGFWRLGVWLAVPAALAVAALGLRALLRRPTFTGAPVPGLHALLADAGEVPYLEALAGLYGAGVPLPEAHARAARASPVAWVRARLERAGEQLAHGGPLTEALAAAAALGPETLRILSGAEHSGTLEEALHRAATRRRQTLEQRAGRAVQLVGGLLYAAAAGLVLWLALDFYGNLYRGLGRLGR